jgi:hypothetical protein
MKRFWNFIGSRDFSIIIFIMGMTHVLVLFGFAFLVPTEWVDSIGAMLPYEVLYGSFFVNLLLCEIRWLPVVRDKCRKKTVEQIHADFKCDALKTRVAPRLNESRFRKSVKRAGYRLSEGNVEGHRYLYAIKGRFSACGSLVFHLGFFLLLLGVVLNLMFRFEGQALLPEGFRFDGSKESYMSVSEAPKSEVPKVEFFLEKIDRSYWDGQVFFTELAARVRHTGGPSRLQLSKTTRIGGAEVTLSAFGYAPAYNITDLASRSRWGNVAVLNIFTPGAEDFFQIPGYPHRIFVALYPDFVEKNGKPSSKSMNFKNPVLSVRVLRGRTIVFNDLVRPNEKIAFDDHVLRITDVKRWAIFKIVAAPGRPYIWAAYIQMLLGLLLRLIFYKKELFLVQLPGGQCRVAGRFDYYNNLNNDWLTHLIVKTSDKA